MEALISSAEGESGCRDQPALTSSPALRKGDEGGRGSGDEAKEGRKAQGECEREFSGYRERRPLRARVVHRKSRRLTKRRLE
jgi:hypothetical protein